MKHHFENKRNKELQDDFRACLKGENAEEKIKNGTVRHVTYEERKRKSALSNGLSPFLAPDEEMEDRQETVENGLLQDAFNAILIIYMLLGTYY